MLATMSSPVRSFIPLNEPMTEISRKTLDERVALYRDECRTFSQRLGRDWTAASIADETPEDGGDGRATWTNCR